MVLLHRTLEVSSSSSSKPYEEFSKGSRRTLLAFGTILGSSIMKKRQNLLKIYFGHVLGDLPFILE